MGRIGEQHDSWFEICKKPRVLAVTSCLFAKFGTQFWAGVETMCEREMSEFSGKSVAGFWAC